MPHLVPSVSAATTGAIVAAHQQKLIAEEERMVTYTREDLEQDWEFKIVRANSAAFRKPENLRNLVEEEAVAGWTMLEKFDDNRVRFKRPSSLREEDANLPEGVDPYRTQCGTPAFWYAVLALGILVGMLLVQVGVALVVA
jgi:hypothetical protein